MATSNLGTSVGLQGNYNNDYLQNLQLQEQKRGRLADEAFRQQEAQRKQQQVANEAMADAVTIEKGRFLPQREDEIKNETLGLLSYTISKQEANPSYNPKMDSEFQKRKIELASKAKTYETERIRAEKDYTEMVNNYDIYDKRALEEGKSVLDGTQQFSPAMKGRTYSMPMVKDFSKFTNLDKHIETAGFLDTQNQTVQRYDAKGNKYLDTVKGYDFSTPEKEQQQFGKALEYVQSTRNNPYIQRLVADAEKQVSENAPSQGIDLASTQYEVFNGMVDNLVAKKIIEVAKNDINNQVKDIDTPAGKGLNLIQNMGNGKYQTKTGFYQVDKDKIDTETREQQFRNFEEKNKDQIIVNWAKQYVKYPANATDTDMQNAKDKAVEKATKMYESESGKKSVQELFNKSYPQGKKVTKVYPALTPKQDGSNPEVNVVDSKGNTIAFTPSFYNIDETTHKPISVYGVEVFKEKGDDGVTRTIQKPVVIPYNAKNKVVNNVAPELAEVYKKETGKDINLDVEESTPSKTAPKKSEYKLSELTVDFINGLGEGEVVVVDGVKRVKQDGKLKKVKK